MKIEIKKTEINDERLVCKGKVVFVKTDYVENCITGYYGTNDGKGNLALTSRGYMGDYFISPIIVSESEEINIGDKFLWKDKIFTLLESDEGNILNDFKNEGKKILVPFEKMVYEILHNIVSGCFNEGEEVFIECKKILDGFDDKDNEIWSYEVLLNYVNIFKIKEENLTFSKSDIKNAFYAGREQRIVHENDSGTDYEFVNSFEEWIENYNIK